LFQVRSIVPNKPRPYWEGTNQTEGMSCDNDRNEVADRRAFAITSWGERARPRLRRAQTGGQLAPLDYGAPKSLGPPRHLHHNDDEIFVVLEGTIALCTRSCVIHHGEFIMEI
jgi:hypothetical protein